MSAVSTEPTCSANVSSVKNRNPTHAIPTVVLIVWSCACSVLTCAVKPTVWLFSPLFDGRL